MEPRAAVPSAEDAVNHRTNTDQGIGQTAVRVLDRTRYRRLSERASMLEEEEMSIAAFGVIDR